MSLNKFKNTKKIGIILFLVFSIIPIQNIFAQVPNVGFVPANIWYSKDPFLEGDKIKIYTLLYNPDEKELSGTVIFFDNTTLLGQKDFKISAKAVKDFSIDWTVTTGDHVIFAKIENAKFLISTGKYEEVYLAENKTEESKRSVASKIITNLSDTIADKITNTTIVSDIGKTIKDKTPAVVSETVGSTINSLENFRTNIDTSLKNKKEAVQNELDVLNKTKISVNEEPTLGETKGKTMTEKLNDLKNSNYILKPFKYVELFFLNILSFIFKTGILFYSLSVVVLFLIIRYFWRLIF
jgi:hypothetical protein